MHTNTQCDIIAVGVRSRQDMGSRFTGNMLKKQCSESMFYQLGHQVTEITDVLNNLLSFSLTLSTHIPSTQKFGNYSVQIMLSTT